MAAKSAHHHRQPAPMPLPCSVCQVHGRCSCFAGGKREMRDLANDVYANYEYDANGNRIREVYTQRAAGVTFQASLAVYDALNRIIQIEDPRYKVWYEYDAVGNRRRVKAEYFSPIVGNLRTQDYYYSYDAMNRFTTTMGTLQNGLIGRGTSGDGVSITYNFAGERTSATYASDGHSEVYSYTGDGLLTDVVIDGRLSARRLYDAGQRVVGYQTFNSSGQFIKNESRVFNADNKLLKTTDLTKNIGNDYFYMADGTLASMVSFAADPGATKNEYTYQYEWWDSAKKVGEQVRSSSTQINPSWGVWSPGQVTSYLDVNGNVTSAVDRGDPKQNVPARTFKYFTDERGNMLRRDEYLNNVANSSGQITSVASKNRYHDFYYFDNRRIGNVGNDGIEREDYAQQLAEAEAAERNKSQAYSPDSKYRNFNPVVGVDFDENYQPINDNYPGAAPDYYTVRSGDSLQSIAQAIWGDKTLWYLLASANGLQNLEPTAVLVESSIIVIPNRVVNIHNTSETFRPYNAGYALGDTSPTIPAPPQPPPPPRKKGCGGIAKVVTVAIAIAAAVYTGGQALMLLTGTSTVAGASAAIALGGSSLALGAAGTLAAAGAAAGFAGSVAGQVAGNLTGTTDGFSLRDAMAGAVAGGITGGLAGGSGALLGSGGNSLLVGARAMAANVAAQGVSKGLGLQRSFSWSGVAFAGVAAAAGSVFDRAVNQSMDVGGALGDFARSSPFATSLARATTVGLVGAALVGSSVRRNMSSIVASALASSAGNAAADRLLPTSFGQQIANSLADKSARASGGIGLRTVEDDYYSNPAQVSRNVDQQMDDWRSERDRAIREVLGSFAAPDAVSSASFSASRPETVDPTSQAVNQSGTQRANAAALRDDLPAGFISSADRVLMQNASAAAARGDFSAMQDVAKLIAMDRGLPVNRGAVDDPILLALNGNGSRSDVPDSSSSKQSSFIDDAKKWGLNYLKGTGSFAPTTPDNKTLGSAVRDLGKVAANVAGGTVELGANLIGGQSIPGMPDYVPFMQKFRFQYDTPAFGDTLELASPLLAARALGGFRTVSAEAEFAAKASNTAILDVPGRVHSRINLRNGSQSGGAGWNHVVNEHFSGKASKSQFTIDQAELRKILQSKEVVQTPVTRILESSNGPRYVREIDLGRNIGIDKFNNFQPTSTFTILTDRYGNLVTTTPGKIK